MRRRTSAIYALLIVAGCGEVVHDTGEACLVPEDLQCEDNWETGGPMELDSLPWRAWGGPLPLSEGYTCGGRYPADTPLKIEALLHDGGGGYVDNERCTVKIDGQRILVKARFWHEWEQDAIVEPGALTSCDVPPLEAGTWTLDYGGTEHEFEVGIENVQLIACALSPKEVP